MLCIQVQGVGYRGLRIFINGPCLVTAPSTENTKSSYSINNAPCIIREQCNFVIIVVAVGILKKIHAKRFLEKDASLLSKLHFLHFLAVCREW